MDLGSFKVNLNDGAGEREIVIMPSDLVRTEEQTGKSITDLGVSFQTLMRLAWNGARRQGIPVADDFYLFVDACDLSDIQSVVLDGGPLGDSGKASAPAPPPGE